MPWHLDIENIAGIRSGATEIAPGINAVRASNWRGKSSLIKSIETAMGTAAPLTDGAESGRVELQTDERTVVVELTREQGEVSRDGDGYLGSDHDRVCASLFAFLDEDNEVRRAVRNGENLEAVLTRPLDFERIDERIRELRSEREQVEAELERAEEAAQQLPAVQERITELKSSLEELRAEREELRAENGAEPDGKRDELSETRAERDRLENRKAQLETTITNTRERLADRREALADLEVPDPDELESDIAQAREELAEVEQGLDLLESVYNANKRVLDADRPELLTEIEHGLSEDVLSCWVCGSETGRPTVEDHLDALATEIADRRETAEEYRERLEELESERGEIRRRRRRRTDLEAEIEDLETTLADREESLQTVTERLDAVTERLDELATEVEASTDRLTDLESDIKYTERELEEARDEYATVEQQVERRELLEEEQSAISAEIEELRTRKERRKSDTREAFDDAMATLLEELAPGFEAARLDSNFDLVVAREGREVANDAMSEGELELLGIVTALAGYEAYDVSEIVPLILLDSVGDLAGENLGPLVRYLADQTTYLVTTAYPEQDVAEDHLIEPAEWSVVSRDVRPEVST